MKKIAFFIILLSSLWLVGCIETGKKINQNQNHNVLSKDEARVIAEKTCIKGGESLTSGGAYNENSKTWWFDANLNATREGCKPACVVNMETKTAEINWRCTGLVPLNGEPNAKICTSQQRKANACIEQYDPVCITLGFTESGKPVKQTFSNSCEACRNRQTVNFIPSYVPGTCETAIEIKKLFVAKYPKYAGGLYITVEKETENYVRGYLVFGEDLPGGIFLAAKIDGKWKIVHEGNGQIPCSLSKYGFPNDMLSDCS